MRGRALVRGRTKINSPDPPLFTVRTAYPTEPLLTLFTHQSSWPPGDHVASSTGMGGSTSRRSASAGAAPRRR